MTRRDQADELTLNALNVLAEDPNGQVSLLRSIAMSMVANCLLLQELLDGSVEVDLERDTDDDDKGKPPW